MILPSQGSDEHVTEWNLETVGLLQLLDGIVGVGVVANVRAVLLRIEENRMAPVLFLLGDGELPTVVRITSVAKVERAVDETGA